MEPNEGDLSSLLSAFSSLNFDGDGGDGVQGVLETLMGQLMSKEILYEPLKELNDKVREPSCVVFEANRLLVPGILGDQSFLDIHRGSSPL